MCTKKQSITSFEYMAKKNPRIFDLNKFNTHRCLEQFAPIFLCNISVHEISLRCTVSCNYCWQQIKLLVYII